MGSCFSGFCYEVIDVMDELHYGETDNPYTDEDNSSNNCEYNSSSESEVDSEDLTQTDDFDTEDEGSETSWETEESTEGLEIYRGCSTTGNENMMNHFTCPAVPTSGLAQNDSTTQGSDSICPICFERPRNMAFTCGHLCCEPCSKSLSECHMCRKSISKKIKLYF